MFRQTIESFSEDVIAQKLADYRAGVRRPGITTASGKKVTSFLDMLVEASETQGSLMSPQEMRDEVGGEHFIQHHICSRQLPVLESSYMI